MQLFFSIDPLFFIIFSMWFLACAFAAALSVIFTNAVPYTLLLLQPTDTTCEQYPRRAPPGFYQDNSTVLRILNDPLYRKESVARHSAAVQVDTQVFDNQPDVADAPEMWTQFVAFHEYLEKTFPKLHEIAEVSKVNTYGLVFHWKGTDSSLKPVMLAAHQDVVPVQKDTLLDWTYPPFEGHYDGTYLFGRGALDCKNLLVALMEALELLVGEKYEPKRGIVVALGFDEEISGRYGASKIAAFLLEKFGKDGIYAIIDEGPGILLDPITKQYVAAPALGEKGYADFKVELTMPGGHSSIPPDHGAVGIMGELAYNIENDQFSPLLTSENPILTYLQCVAGASDKVPALTKKAILRAGFDKLANSKVVAFMGKNPLSKYLVQTSQAINIIRGGEKANALPEDVSMVVNHRVIVGTTIKEVADHFASRVVDLASKYQMDVSAYGEKVVECENPKGTFNVTLFGEPLEFAPVTPHGDKVWEYLASTTRHVFEELVLDSLEYPIIVAPSLMPANTDTKFYWDLTKHIYRFSPLVNKRPFMENHIHSVDESIEFSEHLQMTAFYYQYVQNVDTPEADNGN